MPNKNLFIPKNKKPAILRPTFQGPFELPNKIILDNSQFEESNTHITAFISKSLN